MVCWKGRDAVRRAVALRLVVVWGRRYGHHGNAEDRAFKFQKRSHLLCLFRAINYRLKENSIMLKSATQANLWSSRHFKNYLKISFVLPSKALDDFLAT